MTVSAFGLINGILGIKPNGWGHLTMIVDIESNLITEFEAINK